jgi:hypothetical protein
MEVRPAWAQNGTCGDFSRLQGTTSQAASVSTTFNVTFTVLDDCVVSTSDLASA